MKNLRCIVLLLICFGTSLTSQAQVKNIVLVHGAFADGSGWQKVYTNLKSLGYNVSVVGNPNTGIEDDVAATKRVIDRQDGPVILVGHSYGGAIITLAGNADKVVGLVYIAAFAPDKGETLGGLLSSYPIDPLSGILSPVSGFAWYDLAKYHAGFCADLPKEQAEFMAASQVPVAVSAFTYRFNEIAWKTKPSWHIIATEDHSIPVALERFMSKRTGGKITEIKASHLVFISKSKKVADIIDAAAKETKITSTMKSAETFTVSRSPKSSGTIKQINAGVLNIGYVDEGKIDAPVVLLLHGWPYDIHSFDSITPILVAKGYRVIVPYQRGFGSTTFLSEKTFRNGQQSAFAVDAIALMDALKIDKTIIAGFDWGARTACIMAALWPERCSALVSVSGYLIGNQQTGAMPLTPQAEQLWWYQYYFATERGRIGYEKYKNDFAKLIWQNASPTWKFTEETFNRTASSLSNPDHVAIVLHNYRWRIGIEKGEALYDDLEFQLAEGPFITVPSITIEGDENGAPHPDASAYAKKFTGKYLHKVFTGIGHNPPQESPQLFAQAIIELGNQIKK